MSEVDTQDYQYDPIMGSLGCGYEGLSPDAETLLRQALPGEYTEQYIQRVNAHRGELTYYEYIDKHRYKRGGI